jgi:restriction system protein
MDRPWWISAAVALFVYVTMAIVLPGIAVDNIFFRAIVSSMPQAAPYVASLFLIPIPFAIFNSWRKRQLVDKTDRHPVHSDIELEAVRGAGGGGLPSQGVYGHRESRARADGGVDIRLQKDGQLHLVQCKQWQSQKVGVNVVREMFGLMTAESAASAIVICSGIFTQEAKSFAEGKPIDLVDGAQLEALIGQVRRASREAATPVTAEALSYPLSSLWKPDGPANGQEGSECWRAVLWMLCVSKV